jgi:tricorn protease
VAFEYAGDIWIVDRSGGVARRLTSMPGAETYPHFSPDGSLVAFSAMVGGNVDVYVVPSEGGEPKRLTWHPEEDEVRGWSPDGKRIVFMTQRTSAPRAYGGSPRFWTVALTGGLPTAMPMPRAYRGSYSPDGSRFAYQALAPMDREWRNYRGGQVRPIWVLDLKSYALETLPWQNSFDSDPVWLDNRIYFISDRDLAGNLYGYDIGTRQLTQLTHFTDYDVKTLGAGGGAVVFEQAGYLHLLDPATGKSKRLDITIRGDLPHTLARWEDVSDMLQNASLSPTGKRALFEARGEIFTVPTEQGDWRNLTNSSGAADRSPVWSPDGRRIAWFSDASGEYKLMIGDQDGATEPRAIALEKPNYYIGTTWSPDGKSLAFTDAERRLLVVDVATGQLRVADQDSSSLPGLSWDQVSWSPDGRWLAYSKRLDNGFDAVHLYQLETGKRTRLTDGMADVISPAWDASGKYLWFLASTNYGLNTQWLDMSRNERPIDRGLYLVVLADGEPSPLLPRTGDEAAAEGSTPAPAAGPIKVDLAGIDRRIVAVDLPLRDYVSLAPAGPGVVFFLERVPGQRPTLKRFDLKTQEARDFLAGVQSYSVAADGKKLLYQVGTQWGVVPTTGQVKLGDGRLNTALRMRVDPKAEWRQIFREGWRFERDLFYARNLHGADWDAVWKMYQPLAEQVGHRSDLTYVLDMVGGELSVGHSFSYDPPLKPDQIVKVGLLGADLEEAGGRYRIAKIYTGESWNPDLRAPLAMPGIDVREGDYLLAVNGTELTPPTSPYSLFEGTAGKQTTIRVGAKPSLEGSRVVTVVPVESEYQLRLRAWVESNRRKVDKLSGGKLGYVYLPNTGAGTLGGYGYFTRYYFSQQDKQGVVLDERDNGGGQAADFMVQTMDRKLVGFFSNRVDPNRLSPSPGAGIWGPKVMVINSNAGSGGDMLPYMFRKLKLGPLVGTRTWGGLVATGTVRLIDNGTQTAPRPAFLNTNGQWAVENEGTPPDIEIEETPAEVIRGGDPQLERAVQEALKMLQGWQSPLKRMPPYPIRAKRPGAER